MDGIINIRANGYSIVKDNNCAGAQYESNSMKLRIEFSEDWDGFAKTITFWNALGNNPVRIILTTNLLENVAQSTRVYIVPIPGEAMTEVGMCPFAIDGFDNVTEEDLKAGGPTVIGVCKRTAEDKLKVLPSRKAHNANNPGSLTPDQYNQLQEQIDGISGIIQNAAISAGNAATSAESAATSAESAATSAESAATSAGNAATSAESAGKYAAYAHEALMKVCYIGDNGNWFIWDSDKGQYEDTNVRAQSGSVVYYGNYPPKEADVWIDPDGEPEGFVKTAVFENYEQLIEYFNFTSQLPHGSNMDVGQTILIEDPDVPDLWVAQTDFVNMPGEDYYFANGEEFLAHMEENNGAWVGCYLFRPLNYVKDKNYVHTDNNFTDVHKIAIEAIANNAYIGNASFSTINTTSRDYFTVNLLDTSLTTKINVGDLICFKGTKLCVKVIEIYDDSVSYSSLSEFVNLILTNKKMRLGIFDVELISSNMDLTQIERYVNTVAYLTENAVNYPTKEEMNEAIDVKVPTKTSDLSNDSNFVQDSNYVHTDNNFTNTDKTTLSISSRNAQSALEIAQGANRAVSFNDYSEMIGFFNQNPNWGSIDRVTLEYQVGQNIYIGTVGVPDLWIASRDNIPPVNYTYTTDEAFVNDLNNALANGEFLRVGWITLGILETQKVDLTEYPTEEEMNAAIAGGDPKYELIQTATIEQANVYTFTFNKDLDGNSFKLDAVVVYISCATAPSTNSQWRIGTTEDSLTCLHYFKPDSVGSELLLKSERMGNGLWAGLRSRNTGAGLNNCPMYGTQIGVGVDYVETLYLKFPGIPEGTKMRVYGRRVN